MTDDLVVKLRDEDSYYRLQEKHWCIDAEELERQRLAAADRIEDLEAENERLWEALGDLIEQHEAFRREVSDAVVAFRNEWLQATPSRQWFQAKFTRFIIPQPDPLAEAWIEATGNTVGMEPLNAALAARGLKIVDAIDAD